MRDEQRRRLSIVIVALGLVVAACSGDPTTGYFSDVRGVNQTYITEVADLVRVGPSSSADDLRDFFAERTDALAEAVDGLGQIAPPDEYVAAHNRFMDGLAQFADLSEAIAAESQNLQTNDDVRSLAVHPVFGMGPSRELEAAFVDACLVLQGMADETGATVDLACEDLS
jgi:hypothetical protein